MTLAKKKTFLTKFLLITIISSSSMLFGWNFTFSNVTERIIVICYKLEGLSQEYYQILQPDQSVSYYFPNLHCFGSSILWAEYKDKDAFGRDLPYHGGIDLVDPISGEILKGTAQNIFALEVANKYAFIPMQIKVVDNETFQQTVDAAQDLAEGLDALACETINTTTMFINPVSAMSKSGLNTKTDVSSLGKSLGSSIGGYMGSSVAKKISSMSEEYFNASPETEKISSSYPTDEPPTIESLIEQGMLSSDGQPTYTNKHPIYTNMDIAPAEKKPQPNPTKCRFGLGQIAKAGATLAGITLCRDLHFLIVDTGEIGTPMPTKEGATVSRVKKPLLIAEINQGG